MEDTVAILMPTLAALVVASLTILISNSFLSCQKTLFQFCVFGVTFALALGYIMQADDRAVAKVWQQYGQLSIEIRFCISLIVIGFTYFGGAMYLAAPAAKSEKKGRKNASFLDAPASCDNSTSFDVPTDSPANDKVFFEQFLAKLTNEIVADVATIYEMNDEAVNWISSMVNYNVAGGKMNRGLTVLAAYRSLVRAMFNREITEKERCQAAALGWCIEFLQAFFLVADDIMDGSVTRRGAPCWFRKDSIQMIAINDSFILESFVYKILKKYFGSEAYYYPLVDLFIEVTRQTEFGQLLDLTSQPLQGPIDLSRFTIDRYRKIVRYKTAFYSFYLPVALPMIMCGITDAHLFAQAKEILLIMGEYFQIQDDYLDCYGKPEVIGKIGTDIEDNKCSWLVVQALSRATPEQLKLLRTNYGQKEEPKVKKVKQLYREMDLENLFKNYEEESYTVIQTLLDKVTDMPKDVFNDLLGKIYKRAK